MNKLLNKNSSLFGRLELKKIMKKILILFISLSFSFNVNAKAPNFNGSLNDNIKKYDWELKSIKAKKLGKFPAELYTLEKDGYILKCLTIFDDSFSETSCNLP